MTMTDTNPREIIGGNKPPLERADEVEARLRLEHEETLARIDELMTEARAERDATPTIELDDTASAHRLGALVKKLLEHDKLLEKLRVVDKEPYMRAEEKIDGFFFGQRERIARRRPNDAPGAANVLQAIIDDWQQRRLAAETARRRAAAEEEARKARIAEQERAAAEQAQRETEAAAARARKPENIERHEQTIIERRSEVVQKSMVADVTSAKAEDAKIDALAKPADMVRSRSNEGTTLTMQKVNYAIVVDEALLDKDALWPFISTAEKEKALRAWAKVTNHKQQMTGAEIGSRAKSRVL